MRRKLFANVKSLFNATIMILCAYSLTYAAEDVSSTLLRISKDANKNLPIKVTDDVRWDLTVVANKTLMFKYTFFDETAIKNKSFSAEKYKRAAKQNHAQIFCKDMATIDLFRKGATYNFIYYGNLGGIITEYSLNEKECRNY